MDYLSEQAGKPPNATLSEADIVKQKRIGIIKFNTLRGKMGRPHPSRGKGNKKKFRKETIMINGSRSTSLL